MSATKTSYPRMKAFHHYGRIRKGNEYAIVDEGRDYFTVTVDGKRPFVPKWVFEYDATLARRDYAVSRGNEDDEWGDE